MPTVAGGREDNVAHAIGWSARVAQVAGDERVLVVMVQFVTILLLLRATRRVDTRFVRASGSLPRGESSDCGPCGRGRGRDAANASQQGRWRRRLAMQWSRTRGRKETGMEVTQATRE